MSRPYSEIIADLNSVLRLEGRERFKDCATFRRLIDARFNEDPELTFEDFQHVHRVKAEEWFGTDMEKYLRPHTLYSNKFSAYLAQKIRASQYSATTKRNMSVVKEFGEGDGNQG